MHTVTSICSAGLWRNNPGLVQLLGLRAEIRIPVFVLIIASTVTAIELAMHAWFYGLYTVLGIFVPLIVTNCTIVARAETFASRQPIGWATLDGLAMGAGFTLVLVVLGAVRELLGQGTLLADATLLFGEAARDWTITVSNDYPGFLLAALPPGAFIALSLLVAAKNWLDDAFAEHRTASAATVIS